MSIETKQGLAFSDKAETLWIAEIEPWCMFFQGEIAISNRDTAIHWLIEEVVRLRARLAAVELESFRS